MAPAEFASLALPETKQLKDNAETCFATIGKFDLYIRFCSLAIQSMKNLDVSLSNLSTLRDRTWTDLVG